MKNQVFMLDEDGINYLVEQIAEKLKLVSSTSSNVDEEELLTVNEAAKLIKLSKSTIYGLVHKNEIPYCKKGKRLYFQKSELIDWIREGRRTPKEELNNRVNEYLLKRKVA
ncbi:helix-turn-helix domain-containing protein [Mangrovimonas sp. DI 80]|uniref:helix-turn-helix domain-containing protein n=1 Tax=Mangrovimonas sp. DI 80 TaxID=1779330 RepID=UPI0009785A36|nr:helix-turn-helix domain-containing protein [Mangrovimonas sp. DI 80]OMP30075.1 hypothetical protein BKM32_14450 [Mangrovimonas sp. DI 80]